MKRGLLLGTLIEVVLAIAALVVVISIVASFFTTSNAATESFKNLVSRINELQPAEKDSYPLTLDQGSSVIGFRAGADEMYMTLVTDDGQNTKFFSIDRPSQCPDETSCACLCRGGQYPDPETTQYQCSEINCQPLDNRVQQPITFRLDESRIIGSHGPSPKGAFATSQAYKYLRITNGFFLHRTQDTEFCFARNCKERIQTVYMENENGIKVCSVEGCI